MPAHDPGADALAPAMGAGSIDLFEEMRAVLRALWRHRFLIVAFVFVGAVVSAVLALSLPAQYAASASLLLGERSDALLDDGEEALNPFGNDILVDSESEIIASRATARRAVQDAGLLYMPHLNPDLGWSVEDVTVDPRTQTERMITRTVDTLLDGLTVWPVGRSRVVEVTYRAPTPAAAATVANAIAQAYLDRQIEEKVEQNRTLIDALTERVSQLRAEVAEQEGRVAAYRGRVGLTEDSALVALTTRMSEVRGALTETRSQIAEVGSRMATLARMAANPTMAVPAAGLDSQAMEALLELKAAALADLANARARYQPGHPAITAADRRMAALNDQIRGEISTIRADLELTHDSLKARAASLERTLDDLHEEERQLTGAQVELRALERNAEASRQILEAMLTRLNAVQGVKGTETPDSRLVSAAEPPRAPYAPNRAMVVGSGIVLSVMIALLVVVWIEQSDIRLTALRQAEAWVNAPLLSIVPLLSADRVARTPPQLHVVDPTPSPFADAIRTLLLTLAPHGREDAPGMVLVTGPAVGEGKTTIAVSLGRAMAMDTGMRTLIVDGNRSAPALHGATGCANDIGLVDVLRDDADLERVIQKDPVSHAHLLPMGRTDGLSIRLQDTRARRLAGALCSRYDAVIIDGPGVLQNADAAAWAAVSRSVVMVLSAGSTRKVDVTNAMRALRGPTGGQLAGAVLNRAGDLT